MTKRDLRGIVLREPCASLHFVELGLYFIVLIPLLSYSTLEATRASTDFRQQYIKEQNPEDEDLFTKGWFGMDFDNSDHEWSFWPQWALVLIKWSAFYVVASVAARYLLPKNFHHLTCIAVTSVAFSQLMSWQMSLLMNGIVLLAYVFSVVLRSRVLLWAFNIGIVAFLNYPIYYTFIGYYTMPGVDYYNSVFTLVQYLISMVLLRFTSVGSDAATGEAKPSLLEFFHFSLYLPAIFSGPLQTYQDFKRQYASPLAYGERVKSGLLHMLRVVLWGVVSHLTLHFIYLQLLIRSEQAVSQMNRWAMFGLGLWNGIFFQTKYFVIFGVSASLAKLDGFQLAGPPRCIIWIYHYSAMWKAFDTGLYDTLKTIIYIPLGGSRHGLMRQFLAAGATFAYISYWHGGTWQLMAWCCVDYLGIQLESVCRYLEKTGPARRLRTSVGEAMWRRFYCAANSPLWAWYVGGIFMFFSGLDVGYLYWNTFVTNGSLSVWLAIFLVFYTGCQVSVEYQRRVLLSVEQQKKKDKKKQR